MAGKLISVENINFNAPHSPMGAYMSFTTGQFGALGGIGTQIGKPGNQEVYVGAKNGGRFESSSLRRLPFFTSRQTDATSNANFLVEQSDSTVKDPGRHIVAYMEDQIRREYGWATDRWVTPDFTFSIYTPFGSIPDPALVLPTQMRSSLLPCSSLNWNAITDLEPRPKRSSLPSASASEVGAPSIPPAHPGADSPSARKPA